MKGLIVKHFDHSIAAIAAMSAGNGDTVLTHLTHSHRLMEDVSQGARDSLGRSARLLERVESSRVAGEKKPGAETFDSVGSYVLCVCVCFL